MYCKSLRPDDTNLSILFFCWSTRHENDLAYSTITSHGKHALYKNSRFCIKLVLTAYAMLPVRHVLAAEPNILEEALVISCLASGRRSVRHAPGSAFVRSPRYAHAKPCHVRPRWWNKSWNYVDWGTRKIISNRVVGVYRGTWSTPATVRQYTSGTMGSPRTFEHRRCSIHCANRMHERHRDIHSSTFVQPG